MYKLSTLGRFFFAIAMVAFGIQHFVHLEFVTRVFPRLPAWIPAHVFLSCVFGSILLASSAAICGLAVGRNHPQLVCIAVPATADHNPTLKDGIGKTGMSRGTVFQSPKLSNCDSLKNGAACLSELAKAPVVRSKKIP